MKKFVTLCCLMGCLLALLAVPQAAHAYVKEGTRIPAGILEPLADWVSAATHIDIPALPNAIASDAELREALSAEGVPKGTLDIKGMQRFNAAAAYLPGQIIVNNQIWYPNSYIMQSYLVHELVHHTQLISRKKFPCDAARERDAYTLQNQWLIEHGHEPLVSKKWIDTVSACAGSNGAELYDGFYLY